jgi:protein SCO1/2
MNYQQKVSSLIGGQGFVRSLLVAVVFLLPRLSLAEDAVNVDQNSRNPSYTRMMTNYTPPDVMVVRQDGTDLSFVKELDDGRPVMMNFIFASCSAICPMLSHLFQKVQNRLTASGQKVHLMSISIDPENDTPAVMTEYAKKFSAGPDWNFYTGTRQASIDIQQAFNVYRGDKMNHTSVIVMRAKPGDPWLRLDGFASADEVISEFNKL